MQTMDELKSMVEDASENLALVTGLDLREAAGESRLKANARERVKDRLAEHGLVALPQVPWDQSEEVYLTKVGSSAALLFRAFSAPSQLNMGRVVGSLGSTIKVVNRQDALTEAQDLLAEAVGLLAQAVGSSDSPADEAGAASG